MQGSTPTWKKQLHEVIFEADTFWGKTFDIALMIAITLSVGAVMLESVREIEQEYGAILRVCEWVFTILFTVEYVLRLISIERPLKYAYSFFGVVDLLSILPTYLGLFLVGTPSLIVIRTLRLLRVFRVLKLARLLGEAQRLAVALQASRRKITVFLLFVLTIVVIMGTIMYIVEDPENGFTSIPRSIYWAIVTLTTVGYGDIAPQTVLGQFFAATIMVLGYSILAVPTGIISAEIMKQGDEPVDTRACPTCGQEGHDVDADFCKYCGGRL